MLLFPNTFLKFGNLFLKFANFEYFLVSCAYIRCGVTQSTSNQIRTDLRFSKSNQVLNYHCPSLDHPWPLLGPSLKTPLMINAGEQLHRQQTQRWTHTTKAIVYYITLYNILLHYIHIYNNVEIAQFAALYCHEILLE